jgi:hypothetical protein
LLFGYLFFFSFPLLRIKGTYYIWSYFRLTFTTIAIFSGTIRRFSFHHILYFVDCIIIYDVLPVEHCFWTQFTKIRWRWTLLLAFLSLRRISIHS